MTPPQITWNKYCDIYLRSLGDDPTNPPRPTAKQLAFLMAEKYRDVFYGGSAGGGKAQPLDSQVLTSFGWKRMGDIRVGDTTINPATGGYSTVVAIWPQGEQDIYRFTYDDGATMECTKDHLHVYRYGSVADSRKWRKHGDRAWSDYRVASTEMLLSKSVDACVVRVPSVDKYRFENGFAWDATDWVSRRLVSIEYVGRKEAQCITVDNIYGLYVTDDYIVTHNSVALLLSSLQFVHIQGYTALIVRRSHQDLAKPKAIMDMAKTAFLGVQGVRWSEKNKEFLFPEGGRLLFAYMDGPNDHLFLKGTELQFVGADEASDLRWSQVNYLKSRMRQVRNRDIPLRFRAASNPGGRSHDQLYKLYIDPDTREDRIFIPAGLNDNPYLDADEYRLMLKDLDPVTRAQLEFGDWNVRDSGGYFDREWFGKSVPMAPKKARRVRWWDLASTEKDDNNDPDYTAGALLAMDDDGIVYIEDIINVQYSPMRVETLIRQTAEADGMGVDIWMEQEPGAAGKTTISHYSRKVLPDYSFHGERSTGPKEEYIKSLSSSVEQRNVKLVATPGRPCTWMAKFLEQAEVWPNDNYHDDMIDATSKAFCKLASSKKKVGVWGRRRGNR